MALHLRLIGLAFLTTVFNSAFAGLDTGPLGRRALPLGPGNLLFFTKAAGPKPGYTLHGPAFQAEFELAQVRIASAAAGLVEVRFPGANPVPQLEALEPSPEERGRSQTVLPAFGAIRYRHLYPGIDMVYRIAGSQLKSEFIVAPGADPGAIRIAYGGARTPVVDASGALVLRTSKGEMRESGLNVYQEAAKSYLPVQGRFKVFRENGTVGFELGAYDRTRALIIDPTISFSTYLGGSGFDAATGVAVDSAGNIYITGWTASSDLPVQPGAIQGINRGGVDAFIAKFDRTGSTLLYCTYLGGSGDDRAMSIAVDAAGNAYVAGSTSSLNFPVTDQSRFRGGRKAFVAKLSPAGDRLIYGTLLGGSGYDVASGIAVDSAGNAFVAGATYSTDFPTASPIQSSSAGQQDAFVAELDSTGTRLLFSTYLGGMGDDSAAAIALDAGGNVYVAGATGSPNFPVAGALQPVLGGNQDAFVTKLNPAARAVVYSTYLGGSKGTTGFSEFATAISIDGSGAAYVTGTTYSSDFPVRNALQPTLGGSSDAFLAKLNAAGSALVYSTYLGGRGTDLGNAVRVNASGSACVAGHTGSSNFPLSGPVRSALRGLYDAFVSCFSPGGDSLSFSTLLGGSGSDAANGLAVSGSSIYAVGQTTSMDFSLKGALQTWNGGGFGAFVVQLADPGAAVKADFDRNGVPDLVFQDDITRDFMVSFMGGVGGTTKLSDSGWLGSGTLWGWHLAAVADFNSDGIPDLIWQNDANRSSTVWFMGGPQGTSTVNWTWLDTSRASPGWKIVGAADFNRDAKPDLIWQDESTREAMVWFLGGPQGTAFVGSAWISSEPVPGWRIVASSDFDGDGITDLVWQNEAARTATVWFMGGAEGTAVRTWAWLSSTASPGWTIRGAADFNGDRRPDVIWQNDVARNATVWFLGGTGGTTVLSWSWFSTGNTNATIVAPR